MPIPDDLQDAYPDDWQELREQVLQRAADDHPIDFDAPDAPEDWPQAPPAEQDYLAATGDSPVCQRCGKPNGWGVLSYPDHWETDFVSKRLDRVVVMAVSNDGGVVRPQDLAKESTAVVLTVAHTCQDPRCDELDHLEALCQRCHLALDNEPDQRAKRKRIQAEIRGQRSLVDPAGCPSVVGGGS